MSMFTCFCKHSLISTLYLLNYVNVVLVIGSLAYWFIGSLVNLLFVYWFIGLLVYWLLFIGLLVYWFFGFLVYWLPFWDPFPGTPLLLVRECLPETLRKEFHRASGKDSQTNKCLGKELRERDPRKVTNKPIHSKLFFTISFGRS